MSEVTDSNCTQPSPPPPPPNPASVSRRTPLHSPSGVALARSCEAGAACAGESEEGLCLSLSPRDPRLIRTREREAMRSRASGGGNARKQELGDGRGGRGRGFFAGVRPRRKRDDIHATLTKHALYTWYVYTAYSSINVVVSEDIRYLVCDIGSTSTWYQGKYRRR